MAPKKANPRNQYFKALKEEKLDSIRWCMRHGGVSIRAEDESGHTGVQLCAAGGYLQSLEELISYAKKFGEKTSGGKGCVDLEEPDEDGKTPLMMAAYNGKLGAVHLLVLEGKVHLDAKCENGKTAKDYALMRKNEGIVKFLENPKAPVKVAEPEPTEEEEAQKKVFKAAQQLSTQVKTNQQEEVYKAKVAAADQLEAELAAAPKPIWPEVEAVIKETRRDLSLKDKDALKGKSGALDPALWNCVCLFTLRIELNARALTTLPPRIGLLKDLSTLILSRNALTHLPDEIGSLTKLSNLEVASNELTCLPDSLANLKELKVIDISQNHIESLQMFSKTANIVSLKAGCNALTELPAQWASLEHLGSLAAPANQLSSIPTWLGGAQMLISLDLADNKIEQVPIELGNLTVKKLQSVCLKENPIKDPRIRRFIEDDAPTLVKDLLNHVKKNGFRGEAEGGKKGGGKKGKKGKQKAAAKEESEDDEEGGSIADMLAAINGGGSDSD